MQYSVLISKIRCNSPNKKGTAVHNRNAIHYMATRSGVDLTPIQIAPLTGADLDRSGSAAHNRNAIHYMATRSGVDLTPLAESPELTALMDEDKKLAAMSSDAYIKALNNHPNSHGLFGNIPVDDLQQVEKDVYKIARQKNIYRGIVSIWQGDAEQLDYYDKAKWLSFLNATLPDVASEFGVPIEQLQWVAAFHNEKSHPHVHYSFWSSGDEVRSPFISVAKQHRCREILSEKMFEEARLQEVMDKTMYRDLILDLGKQAVNSSFDDIKNLYTPGALSNEAPERLSSDQLDTLAKELMHISKIIPQQGRINYQFMPPEVKKQIDTVTDHLINSAQILPKYMEYCSAVTNISKAYSTGKKKEQYTLENAKYDLNKRLSNVILKAAKELRNTNIPFPAQYLTDSRAEASSVEAETSYWEQLFAANVPELPEPDYPEPAAKSNNANAIYDLSKIYLRCEDSQKKALAIHLLEKLAQNNYAMAQYTLGKIYSENTYTEKDITAAISCFEQAGKQGNDFALYSLGKIYLDKDIGKAITFFQAAADQGNQYAQLHLASIFLFGKNVPKDEVMAHKWLDPLLAQNFEPAKELLDYYENMLYEQAFISAQSLFTKFFCTVASSKKNANNMAYDYQYRSASKQARKEAFLKLQSFHEHPDSR